VMQDDPIVEEVHEARRKLLEECGGDLEALMNRLKEREGEDFPRIRRWTREEFERLIAGGYFRPDERVELVNGIICSIK
jgi:hypothetical protein